MYGALSLHHNTNLKISKMTNQEFNNSKATNLFAQSEYFKFALAEIQISNIDKVDDNIIREFYKNEKEWLREINGQNLKGKWGYDFAYFLIRNPKHANAEGFINLINSDF